MTEEEQGAAEWLRGIADKYQSEDGFGCREIVEMLGFCCDEIEMCNKCRVKAMKAIADRIDREMAEYELLKKENAELKAELADWKGNAEGFQPDSYMKLPLDADGEPIRVGDEVNIDGDAMTVLGYRLHDDMLLLVAKDKKRGLFFTPEPSRVRHFKPELADSWEKLEADANKTVCGYVDAPLDEDGLTTCEGCRFEHLGECHQEMARDVLKRAKKLAGIDGGLRGSYGERVKRPAPKVLDADGVSINVGDTVYCDGEDEALTVTSISGVGGEYCCVTVKNADSSHCTVDALRLTHELPDSWRLWGDDLDAAVKVGEVDKVEMMRRAKALAKAGEGL